MAYGGVSQLWAFFSVPMHLYVYPYTRQTCTHCGPAVLKRPHWRRLAPPLCVSQPPRRSSREIWWRLLQHPSLAGGCQDYGRDPRNQIKSRNLLTARLRNALTMSLARLPPPSGRHRRSLHLRGGTAPCTIFFFPLEKAVECREGEKSGLSILGWPLL